MNKFWFSISRKCWIQSRIVRTSIYYCVQFAIVNVEIVINGSFGIHPYRPKQIKKFDFMESFDLSFVEPKLMALTIRKLIELYHANCQLPTLDFIRFYPFNHWNSIFESYFIKRRNQSWENRNILYKIRMYISCSSLHEANGKKEKKNRYC